MFKSLFKKKKEKNSIDVSLLDNKRKYHIEIDTEDKMEYDSFNGKYYINGIEVERLVFSSWPKWEKK